MRYRLSEIERVVLGELRGPDALATGASCDSRTLKRGDVFFAIKGQRDGVDFVAHALEHGAAGAVVPVYFKGTERPVIVVEDTLKALWSLAFFHRNRFGGKVIGITGSVGKTGVKDMIGLCLARRFKVCTSPASFNNHLGLPLSLLAAQDEDFAVLEIGTNHPGEIASLSGMSRPHIGVITGVGRSHLEFLGDTLGVAREKSSLIESLDRGGTVFLPEDILHEEVFLEKLRDDLTLIRFGPQQVSISEDGVSFSFRGQRYALRVPNIAYAHNGAAAVAVALELGLSPGEIRGALLDYRPTGMRMRRLEIRGITVINDAYNSNPDSAQALVESLPHPEITTLVLGDMLELGREGPGLHRELGEAARARGFKRIVCVGEMARHIARGAAGAGEVLWFPDATEAGAFLAKHMEEGEIMVLKASRLVGLEKILEVMNAI